MDDILNTILAALAAGAAVSAKDTAGMAVKDAYNGLKELLKDRFKGSSKAEVALAEYEDDPETYAKPLRKVLSEERIDLDPDVIEAAHQVLALNPSQQVMRGKYNVNISGDVHGMVTGENHNVTMNFGNSDPQNK